MTIHRVQGSSLDRAVIALGIEVWAHKQAYVALCRVRTLAGVLFSKFDVKCLRKTSKTDPLVLAEKNRLQDL